MFFGTFFASVFIFLALARFRAYRRQRACLPHPIRGVKVMEQLKRALADRRGVWELFDEWCKRFGSICSFSILGSPVIIIGSADIARDLLDKRSEIYSSRPRLVTAHEILSGGLRGISAPYGEFWKKWRKVQHLGLNAVQALQYCEFQDLEATILLRDLSRDVNRYREIIERYSASVSFCISFGRRVKDMNNPDVEYMLKTVPEFLRATTPGKYIVDYLPILLKLPRRLQWFRHEFDKIFDNDVQFFLSLLQITQRKMAAGTQKECLAARALESRDHGFTDAQLAYVVAAPFSAGIHTTSATIQYGILAAVLFPDVTRKIQTELDKVVGRDRMPSFSDKESLPYMNAWIKELERWRPAVPMAGAHAVTRDDEYKGFFIPKNSTVYGNLYTILQDPSLFPEPEAFKPERFLPAEDGSLDDHLRDFTLPFGFGRRICAGIPVGNNSLFIAMSRLFWAFKFVNDPTEPAPDANAYITDGPLRTPALFAFGLLPRFPGSAQILELEVHEAESKIKEWD